GCRRPLRPGDGRLVRHASSSRPRRARHRRADRQEQHSHAGSQRPRPGRSSQGRASKGATAVMSLITTHNTDIRIPVSIAQDIDTRGNCAFDWAAAILSGAFIGGVFLDGWAHTHGRVDDTFFTPWHAILYAAFLALATLLVGRAVWGLAGLGSGR